MDKVGMNPFPASGVQRGDGEMVKPSRPPKERNIMRFIEKKVMRGFWQIFLAAAFILAAGPAYAVTPVNSSFWSGAIKGYDPVAYFKEMKPVKGKNAYTHTWMKAKWYF